MINLVIIKMFELKMLISYNTTNSIHNQQGIGRFKIIIFTQRKDFYLIIYYMYGWFCNLNVNSMESI